MPTLIATNKFLENFASFRGNDIRHQKVAKTPRFFETNPLHPGLHLERIVNNPSTGSIRVDGSCRITLDPTALLPGGNPDWTADVVPLRILAHNDLYRYPR